MSNTSNDDYIFWPYITMCRYGITKEDVKLAQWVSEYDILIIFTDNTKYIYDTFTGYHRTIKYKDANLTEDEWKFEFKERLKQLMARKCITQKEMAEKIGTTQSMVSKYISGESLPNVYLMNKIINTLGCKVTDIIFIPYILSNYIYKEEK